jgi:hypothetical protein
VGGLVKNQAELERDLTTLSRRAIVAFATRCARRVEPLTHRMSKADRQSVVRAIDLAEEFVRGPSSPEDILTDAREAARAASATTSTNARSSAADALLNSSAALAAEVAAFAVEAAVSRAASALAAAEALESALTALVALEPQGPNSHAPRGNLEDRIGVEAERDLDRLRSLNLGPAFEPGQPFDPSEAGPLGLLWTPPTPAWWYGSGPDGWLRLIASRLRKSRPAT